jgi:hypothetical protein
MATSAGHYQEQNVQTKLIDAVMDTGYDFLSFTA